MSKLFSEAYKQVASTKPDCPKSIRNYKKKTSGFVNKVDGKEEEPLEEVKIEPQKIINIAD